MPQLNVSEEFNDNILESRSARSEFVTRVQPAVSFTSMGKWLALDLSTGLDYRHYARGTRGDELDPRAGLSARMGAPDDFLMVELGETYSRVSTNVARNTVAESSLVNQTEQNAAFVTPRLLWRLGETRAVTTGYRFSDTRYWSSSGVDKQEHAAFAEFSTEVVSGLTANAGYNFSYLTSDPGDIRRHDVYGGFKYLFTAGSSIFGRVGNSWQMFEHGGSDSNIFWDAGASSDLRIFTVTVGTKKAYSEDPLTLSTKESSYFATLSKDFRRSAATLSGSYSEYESRTYVSRDRRYKTQLTASGNYLLSEGVVLRTSLSGDHLSQSGGSDYPYHLYANAGLDYSMNKYAVLGLNYSHISYRNRFASSTGAAEVNRVILEARLSL